MLREKKIDKQIWLLIGFFGLLKFILHLSFLSGYGFHADELYYISLAKNLSWGYLDISPWVTWMAKLSSYLGHNEFAFRLLPTLFSVATVVFTGIITSDLGGKKLAVIISCSAIICSPAFLATSYLMQPVAFDMFFWTCLTFNVIRFLHTERKRYLYLLFVTIAFGILNKYTILLYAATLFLSLFFLYPTKTNLVLKSSSGPFLVVILLLSPHLYWQITHHWPAFNYVKMVGGKNWNLNIWDYLYQLSLFHGAGVAVWTAGFIFLIKNRKQRQLGIWPLSFVVVIVILAFFKGKLYYGLGLFPVMFAAGGCCWELAFEKKLQLSKYAFVISLYFFGLLSLPLVLPVLSMEKCRRYIAGMVSITSFSRPLVWEDGYSRPIPQFFADMCGWETLAKRVALIKNQNHFKPVIFTNSYAIAGALDYYNTRQAEVISAQNSYILYSPLVLPSTPIIYLSADDMTVVSKLSQKVVKVETLRLENSHLDGINIYILNGANSQFQRNYQKQRQEFLME